VTARIIFMVNPFEIDLLKATSKKEMWIPTFTKHDGTVVQGHYAHVHVSDDHDDHKVLSGQGSATQKEAHKNLTKHGWFNELPEEHKVPVLLKHATELQDAASMRARAAKFRVAILSGATPIPSQVKAFLAQDAAKRAKAEAEFEKAGKLDAYKAAVAAYQSNPDQGDLLEQQPAEAAAAPAPEATQPEAPASPPEQAPPKQDVAPEPTPVAEATPQSDELKKVKDEIAAKVEGLKGMDFEAMNELGDTFPHYATTFLYGIAAKNDEWIKEGQATWEGMSDDQKAASLPLLEACIKTNAEYDIKHAEKLDGDEPTKYSQAISILNGLKKQYGLSDYHKDTIDSFAEDGEFDDLKDYANALEQQEKFGAAAYAKQKLAEAQAGKGEAASAAPQSNETLDGWVEAISKGKTPTPEQAAAYQAAEMSPNGEKAYAQALAGLTSYHEYHFPDDDEDEIADHLAHLHDTALSQVVKPSLGLPDDAISDPPNAVDKAAALKAVSFAKSGDLAKLKNLLSWQAGGTATHAWIGNLVKKLEAHQAASAGAAPKPEKPQFENNPFVQGLVDGAETMLNAGDAAGLKNELDKVSPTAAKGSPIGKYGQYVKDSLAYLGHPESESSFPTTQEEGPKEGDTKVENGVTYVLKNGRWHKVGGDEPSGDAAEPTFTGKTVEYYKKVAAKVKALVEKGDSAAVLAMMNEDSKTWAGTSPNSKALIQYAKQLATPHAQAEQPAEAAPAPEAPAAPAAAPDAPESIDGWTKTGGQKGSNEGGEYADEHGQKWYCKFPASEAHTKNELLAAKLYEAAGIEVPELKLITLGGKVGIASKIIDGVKKDSSALAAGAPGVAEGFAVDAWLANWDVVGTGYDNMQIKPNGHAVRLDVGGALLYRAMGAPKGDAFGKTVGELNSLKDGTNVYAAHAFKGLTDAQIHESMKKVAAVSPETITALCEKYGPGDEAEKLKLAAKLVERRADVLSKLPIQSATAPGIASVKETAPEPAPVAQAVAPTPAPTPAAAPAVDVKTLVAQVPVPKMEAGTGKIKYAAKCKELKLIAETQGAEGLKKKIATKGDMVKIAGFKVINSADSKYGTNAELMAKYAKALYEAVVGANAVGSGEAPATAAPKIVAAKEVSPAAPAAPEAKPDLRKLKVDAAQLPKPLDFHNYKGQGQGLSSKTHVNAANAKDQADVLEFAKKGDLIALQKYQYEAFDKETGASIGMKSIVEHPSKHVKEFWEACCATLELIAFPPAPLKAFDEHVSEDIKALSESFKPHLFGKSVHHVPANEKLGFWIALGMESAWNKFKPKETKSAVKIPGIKEAGYKLYEKYNANVKHFIKSVQATGSYNNAYREGKDTDSHGKATRPILHDLYAAAQTKPAGTTITKWISMDQEMIDQFMKSSEGLVFQNPGSMCCSMSPTGTKGFGSHCMTIHYAPGAKAIDTFGSGSFSGEMEITTLPGARFMVLSRKMEGESFRLEVLMLPPDQTYIDTILK
jgi:hypothetical protein